MDEDKVVKAIVHYQQNLEKYIERRNEAKMIYCMEKLQRLPITVSHLEQTGVGRTVNSVRKMKGIRSSPKNTAKQLVSQWKKMVTEEEDSEPEEDTEPEEEDEQDEDDSEDRLQIYCDDAEEKQEVEGDGDEGETRNIKMQDSSHFDETEEYDIYRVKERERERERERVSEKYCDTEKFDFNHVDSHLPRADTRETRIVKHANDCNDDDYFYSNSLENSKNGNLESSEHCDEQDEVKVETSSNRDKDRASDKYDKHKKHKKTNRECSEERGEKRHKDRERGKEKEREKDKEKENHQQNGHKKSSSSSSSKYKSKDKDSHKSSKSSSGTSSSSSNGKDSKEKSKESRDKEKDKGRDSKKESKEKEHKEPRDKHKEKDRKDRDVDNHKKSKESSSKKSSSSLTPSSSQSSSSTATPSSSSKKRSQEEPKTPSTPSKKLKLSIQDGIDCESGASFAEALGMMMPSTSKKKDRPKESSKERDKDRDRREKHKDGKAEKDRERHKEKERNRERERHGEHSKDRKEKSSTTFPKALQTPPAKEDLGITNLLPQISTNYKPIGFLPGEAQRGGGGAKCNDDEMLSRLMYAKNQRTKVYSGNKVFYGVVPTLFDYCIRLLQDNIDTLALGFTGGVPYSILKPVLDRATPSQLFSLEHYNTYLMDDSDELWKLHCQREFKTKQRNEMETWREMYLRCIDEREAKLKSLTANIKLSQDKSLPVRQTKLAYVDTIAAPPRSIAKKQAKNGISNAKPSVTPSSRLQQLAMAGGADKIAVPNPGASRVNSSSGGGQRDSYNVKPKKAPLMAKTLQLMKGRFRR